MLATVKKNSVDCIQASICAFDRFRNSERTVMFAYLELKLAFNPLLQHACHRILQWRSRTSRKDEYEPTPYQDYGVRHGRYENSLTEVSESF
jgi:hypothetical protein